MSSQHLGMPVYELTFEVSSMDDALEDRLMDELDAFPACASGVWTVTLNQADLSALDAAKSAFELLRRLGAIPVRLVEDLVTRSEIASRCETTPQAVGLWMRGERRALVPPPSPMFTAGVDLWLWEEVASWLRAIGRPVDPDLKFPSRSDHQIMNGLIAASVGWNILPIVVRDQLTFTVESAAETSTLPAPQRATQRLQFDLAA